MGYEVGDKVVHWAYGVGEIIQIDKKMLGGHDSFYYKVQIRDLTIWVPVDDANQTSLRLPTPAKEFDKLFGILRETGVELSTDRLERKNHFSEALRSGSLEAVCGVIRDLSTFSRVKKLNDNDAVVLDRAKNLLLDEWRLSFDIPMAEAQKQLKNILNETEVEVIK
jgi:RNA polymerase-interacting CarD/CdnL/TRCF family regulator